MRIQLFSDLHLERDPAFQPLIHPGTDVIVLAGDIGSYQARSRLQDDDFGLARFAPRHTGAPAKVLYVPGNHEFDGLEYDDAYERLRRVCDYLGIAWLDRESIVLDGVRFIGSTLWSDFDAVAGQERDLTKQLQARGKAFRAANYYLSKNTTFRGGEPVLAEQQRAMSLACQDWLRSALAIPFDGPTVVVTHYAPSLRSADPRYGVTPGTAGFCNSMDELIPWADLWMHGHLHCTNDYVVEGELGGRPRSCRVVANPLGYANKGEQEAFRPELVIEIGTA
ncbi:metallophosphoesterase [Massilia sp. WF1]|uniref:metallophosphoesterase n=1 Tax=unclassified Massilia TaxID=2609279 RepID=UPI00064B07F9|nr:MULTISPECIES: metallophosphoesterase [unclassified Massilia]ALK97370.1 metallophosphoesterase [Massilia sp. WG5]KLU36551.1 metallophosphoesterase [Massilia sp. WF1]